MNTRERWIVYPLLALALGSSIKSHIVRRVECDTLVASNIEIVDRRSRRQAILKATPNGGELVLISADTPTQATISSSSIRTQSVQIVGPNGRLQGTLTASPNGAILKLHDQHGRGHTQMGLGQFQTVVVQATLINSGKVRVVGSDNKPQVVLKATAEGFGQLHLINKNNGAEIVHFINENNGASIRRVAPADSLVPPAQVDGNQPAEKKPEPKKETDKPAPKK